MATLAQQGIESIFDALETRRQASGYYKKIKLRPDNKPAKLEQVTKECTFKVGDKVARVNPPYQAGIVTKVTLVKPGQFDVEVTMQEGFLYGFKKARKFKKDEVFTDVLPHLLVRLV